MKHEDLASADISRIHSAASSGNGEESGGGGNGGGAGPGGAHLYPAAWYREPPRSALESYMRPNQDPGKWARIACRTIENWRVEDCYEMAEEPRGSGMARVLREAAWQFQVRPPRINGKVQIGTWVTITYYFTRSDHEVDIREPPGE